MAVEYIHFLVYSGKKDGINKINTTDKKIIKRLQNIKRIPLVFHFGKASQYHR